MGLLGGLNGGGGDGGRHFPRCGSGSGANPSFSAACDALLDARLANLDLGIGFS